MPSQPRTHSSHTCTACTHTSSRARTACTHVQSHTRLHTHAHTHTRPQHSRLMLHRPPTPCPHPYPIWGAVPHAHSATHCGVAQGNGVLRRLESPRVLPLAPLCSPAAPQRPTPTREPGGCWEAQAPTQHHFLLSLWCRARPGQGDAGAPQDTQVAQVGAACATRRGTAEDRTWA